ncbi:MAG: DUF933 domain-containing protein [Desulfobacterales bacterium]|nr:DUF933 domain-containing protein [Desulfobacterales bacterium]
MMGLISFFTVGGDEVKAWTVSDGTVATPGRRRHPLRYRAGLHPGRGRLLRSVRRPRRYLRVPDRRHAPARRQVLSRPGRGHHQFPFRRLSLFPGGRRLLAGLDFGAGKTRI